LFLIKQGVALTGRNTTGPPWNVGRPTARTPCGRSAGLPAVLQTTTNDRLHRRQRAKQYWPIKRASNNLSQCLSKIRCKYYTSTTSFFL